MPHAVPSINNELLSRVVFARMKVDNDVGDVMNSCDVMMVFTKIIVMVFYCMLANHINMATFFEDQYTEMVMVLSKMVLIKMQ